MKYRLGGILYGVLRDVAMVETIISDFEKKRVYIALIPCWIVIDYEIMQYAIYIALKDFESGINRAKKPHIELLLRLAGKDQIRETLDFFKLREGEQYAIIIFLEKDATVDLENIKVFLKESKVFEEISEYENQCKPHIDDIIRKHNISFREIDAVKRSYEDTRTAIKKIIMEKIALALLK
ncbi:MAG: KEOPS complex subunit Cgi121 [Candidatus Njordarchaeales archaeon]